eukprot:1528-Heterococcus_DN1.PRE.5
MIDRCGHQQKRPQLSIIALQDGHCSQQDDSSVCNFKCRRESRLKWNLESTAYMCLTWEAQLKSACIAGSTRKKKQSMRSSVQRCASRDCKAVQCKRCFLFHSHITLTADVAAPGAFLRTEALPAFTKGIAFSLPERNMPHSVDGTPKSAAAKLQAQQSTNGHKTGPWSVTSACNSSLSWCFALILASQD